MWKFHKNVVWVFLLFLTVSIQIALSDRTSYSDEYKARFKATAKQLRDSGCKEKLVPGYQCMRECKDGEKRRICYFYFIVEEYTAAGGACAGCMPNNTNQLTGYPHCECVAGNGIEKTVFVYNRMLPGPCVQICKGDYVMIDVENRATGLEVTTHWHGLRQKGYQYSDGVPHLTQCAIPSGTTYRYQFGGDDSGTHFYHSHVSVHMMDGQYGGFIIRDPPSMDPHYHLYDHDLPEHVMVIHDWMHTTSIDRLPGLQFRNPGQAADALLINGVGIYTGIDATPLFRPDLSVFRVAPGKRYRFRLIFACSTVCPVKFSIEKHSFLVIATDGVPIEPVEADALIAVAAERYDIIVTTSQATGRYWIQARGLLECASSEIMQYAYLEYYGSHASDLSSRPTYSSEPTNQRIINSLDAEKCKSSGNEYCIEDLHSAIKPDKHVLRTKADYTIQMPFSFFNYTPRLNSYLFEPGSFKPFLVAPAQDHLLSMMGNIAFEEAGGPLLSKKNSRDVLCSAQKVADCPEACTCSNYEWIDMGAVVDVYLMDMNAIPELNHPFHLHGYSFYVMCQVKVGGNRTQDDMREALAACQDQAARKSLKHSPVMKDTVMVRSGSVLGIRFLADNPGWWFFHCHFEWHVATGMAFVFRVGEDNDLPKEVGKLPRCPSWLPFFGSKTCS